MKSLPDVILRPIITEKSSTLSRSNKYTFEVSKNATKWMIRRAFEKIFHDRSILSIQTLKIKGHRRRTKSGYTQPIDKKKAIVTASGARIEYFPEVN